MLDPQTLKTALTATPECLSMERLEALVPEAAPSDPHVKQCPRCQAELAMLRAFESDAPLPDEGAAVAWISASLERQREHVKTGRAAREHVALLPQFSWLGRMFKSTAARVLVPAGVLALVVAAVIVSRSPKQPELRADAGNHAAVYRSQTVELVA